MIAVIFMAGFYDPLHCNLPKAFIVFRLRISGMVSDEDFKQGFYLTRVLLGVRHLNHGATDPPKLWIPKPPRYSFIHCSYRFIHSGW